MYPQCCRGTFLISPANWRIGSARRRAAECPKSSFAAQEVRGLRQRSKFARAHTKRPGILYAGGGFPGLTCGALSLMDNPFWTAEFGPLLPDTKSVPFAISSNYVRDCLRRNTGRL